MAHDGSTGDDGHCISQGSNRNVCSTNDMVIREDLIAFKHCMTDGAVMASTDISRTAAMMGF